MSDTFDAKFDIGAPHALVSAPVPWTYGENRITALVRSPDSLYLFWEITDDAIALARTRLGPSGAHAWTNLRIYDTTGRHFDGTNANHYFDIGVPRDTREYFLMINRPTSTVHAEIGLMSPEGYFQPIARSGAAAFPRCEPSPNTHADWMTVTSPEDVPAARPCRSRYAGPAPTLSRGGDATQTYAWTQETPAWESWIHEGAWTHGGAFWRWTTEAFGERVETERFEWQSGPWSIEIGDVDRIDFEFQWGTPMVLASEWGPVEIRGPWSVVIRSFGPEERRVLSQWTVHWVRSYPGVAERWLTTFERRSTTTVLRERVTVGASEHYRLREIGASEVWRIGASERLFFGASRGLFFGSSETAARGASLLGVRGASFFLFAGSSGASRFLGSSQQRSGV